MASMIARFFADVKSDRTQAVKASLLSNAALATAVHPLNGQTALQAAVQASSESVIRALRRHGARWTDVDPSGNNAVHYVAKAARADLCRTRKSADWVMALHQPNAAGETPLHTVLGLPESSATAEIIQAFVAVGADINRRNREGQSALDLAGDRMHLVQMMRDAATAALGHIAPQSSFMGGESIAGESMMGGNSFIGGALGGVPLATGSTPTASGYERGRQPDSMGSEYSTARQRAASAAGDRSSLHADNRPNSREKARSGLNRQTSGFAAGGTGGSQTGGSIFASNLTGESAGGSRSTYGGRRQGSFSRGGPSSLRESKGQSLGGIGGGATWGFGSPQDTPPLREARPTTPPSAATRRRAQTPPPSSMRGTASSVGGMGGMRRPAPIRTGRRDDGPASLQPRTMPNVSDYEGDVQEAPQPLSQGPAGNMGSMHNLGNFRDPCFRSDHEAHTPVEPEPQMVEVTVELPHAVPQKQGPLHSAAPDGQPSEPGRRLNTFSSFGRSRLNSMNSRGSRRASMQSASAEAAAAEEEAAAESPQHALQDNTPAQLSMTPTRGYNGSGLGGLAPPGTSASAMELGQDTGSVVSASSSARRQGLTPRSAARLRPPAGAPRSPKAGKSPSKAGRSPRGGAPGTPGSVRSSRGRGSLSDGTPLQDQVKQMQHALEKAASAMRQLQEDRKADSSELSDFAKCMDAMTERMDIMDRALQNVVDEQAAANERGVTDFEARKRVEKVHETCANLEADTQDGKQWMHDTEEKLGEFWSHLEDLVARLGGVNDDGEAYGLVATAHALEDAVDDLKTELGALRSEFSQKLDAQAAGATSKAPAQVQADAGDAQASAGDGDRGLTEGGKAGPGGGMSEDAVAAAIAAAVAEHSGKLDIVRGTQAEVKGDVSDLKEDLDDVKGAVMEFKDYIDDVKRDAEQAVQVVTTRVDEVHGAQAEVRSKLDTFADKIVQLETATAAAQTKAEDAAAAVAEVEAAKGAAQEIGSLSSGSSPRKGGGAVPSEVMDRLQEVVRKVDLLEDRVGDVAAGAKAAYAVTGDRGDRGRGVGSGSSASPPRTPEASEGQAPEDGGGDEKQLSLEIGSDVFGPQHAPSQPEREITASKAMLYTNVYSGPSQTLEYTDLSDRVTAVRDVAEHAGKEVMSLRSDIDQLKAKNKELTTEVSRLATAPKTLGGQTLGDRFDDSPTHDNARLQEIQEVALRADAAREETEEAVGLLETRVGRAEHAVQLLQHAVHQHDERIAALTYSPNRNSSVTEGNYALKSTVEALETKIMQVEVQYAGRLQAQKAKNDQQAAQIQALLERVQALETRSQFEAQA